MLSILLFVRCRGHAESVEGFILAAAVAPVLLSALLGVASPQVTSRYSCFQMSWLFNVRDLTISPGHVGLQWCRCLVEALREVGVVAEVVAGRTAGHAGGEEAVGGLQLPLPAGRAQQGLAARLARVALQLSAQKCFHITHKYYTALSK